MNTTTPSAPAVRRVTSVKTPGVPTPDAADVPDGDAEMSAAADLDGQDAAAPEQFVTMTPAQLQAAIARGVNAVLDARAKAAAPLKEADLPDQSEIDPKSIKRPTLSKQGYVVPANYGEPADPSIKR